MHLDDVATEFEERRGGGGGVLNTEKELSGFVKASRWRETGGGV